MPQLPLLTGEQLIKILKKYGFVLKRISGSHHVMVNEANKLTVVIPVHSGKQLGRGITAQIVKDAGLRVEDIRI